MINIIETIEDSNRKVDDQIYDVFIAGNSTKEEQLEFLRNEGFFEHLKESFVSILTKAENEGFIKTTKNKVNDGVPTEEEWQQFFDIIDFFDTHYQQNEIKKFLQHYNLGIEDLRKDKEDIFYFEFVFNLICDKQMIKEVKNIDVLKADLDKATKIKTSKSIQAKTPSLN